MDSYSFREMEIKWSRKTFEKTYLLTKKYIDHFYINSRMVWNPFICFKEQHVWNRDPEEENSLPHLIGTGHERSCVRESVPAPQGAERENTWYSEGQIFIKPTSNNILIMTLLRIAGKGAWDVKNNIRIRTAPALIANESTVPAIQWPWWLSFEPLCFQEQSWDEAAMIWGRGPWNAQEKRPVLLLHFTRRTTGDSPGSHRWPHSGRNYFDFVEE